MGKDVGKSSTMQGSLVSRRDFHTLSVAAGIAAVASATPAMAALTVAEKDVEIKTADGTCDAAYFHPINGIYPGVMIWTDAFGLRPTIRDLAKRLAAEGYAVLAPNPYYRTAKAPVIDNPAQFDFSNADSRAKMQSFTGPVQAEGATERDAAAYVAFLDAQKEVDTAKKIGVQGYCMGGPLMMRTAAAIPGRIGAGASFHGGSLVTTAPNSPHLLIPKTKAQFHIAIAEGDDTREPTAKDTLRKAFDDAKIRAEIEVYPGTLHGWCMPDMPLQNGSAIYNMKEAERALANLVALYKRALA